MKRAVKNIMIAQMSKMIMNMIKLMITSGLYDVVSDDGGNGGDHGDELAVMTLIMLITIFMFI